MKIIKYRVQGRYLSYYQITWELQKTHTREKIDLLRRSFDGKNDGKQIPFQKIHSNIKLSGSRSHHPSFLNFPEYSYKTILNPYKNWPNQLRFYYFVLIASLRDIGKEKTIKEE